MMSTQFHCDDTATLVAFVYDDIEPLDKAAVSRHLVECARCRDEVAALGGVREALGAWSPPVPELRFTVVPESAVSNVVRPNVPAWQTVPRWAQLVAATLALAVGASVANVQVRHDANGWTVTTGWMTPAAPAQAVAAPAGVDAQQFQMAMTALEQSLRREMAARPVSAPAATPAASTASADADTLARVRALIEASEKRQQQELALRLTQFGRDFDLQRRADLVRVEQGLGQLEGRTGAEVARQREAINYLIRAGLRPQQ